MGLDSPGHATDHFFSQLLFQHSFIHSLDGKIVF